MDSPSREDLRRRTLDRADQELYEILFTNRADYTADAVEIAEEEFRRRGLIPPAPPSPEVVQAEAQAKAEGEAYRKRGMRQFWRYVLAALILSALLKLLLWRQVAP